MIIDFHTHVLPPRIKNDRTHYINSDTAFAGIYGDSKAKIATADDLIDSMDREGIDFSVILNYSWSTPELCIETNDYILEAVARFPKRLAGFCSVPSCDDTTSLAEIERCTRGGARGIGELRPDLQTPIFTDKESMEPFVSLLLKHKLILLLHSSEPVGHIYPGKGIATPEMLYGFIMNFPDLPIVCAHWGGGLPFYTLMPEVREMLKNVYFDTAASPFLYKPEIYLHVSRIIGADRILLGSDYPLMPPSRLLKEIDSLELPEESRNDIVSGNACRLLGL
jgi:predicted TIM-barrel fold metal-dependent hydrolase